MTTIISEERKIVISSVDKSLKFNNLTLKVVITSGNQTLNMLNIGSIKSEVTCKNQSFNLINKNQKIVISDVGVSRSLVWQDYVTYKVLSGPTIVTDGVRYDYENNIYRFITTTVDVNGYPNIDAFYSDIGLSSLLAQR